MTTSRLLFALGMSGYLLIGVSYEERKLQRRPQGVSPGGEPSASSSRRSLLAETLCGRRRRTDPNGSRMVAP
jgi:hypothetical protein